MLNNALHTRRRRGFVSRRYYTRGSFGDALVLGNTSILINSLRMSSPTVKQVWFTDDYAGAGRIKALYD